MRIGINTQMLATNYGGILQNFALQKVLKNLGHEVVTFDIGKYSWFEWIIDSSKVLVKKILGRKSTFNKSPIYRKKIESPLRRFVYKNISLTTPRTKFLHRGLISKYAIDTIIVGSDQVWRPCYNKRIEDMFLAFAQEDKVRKIAYAASFGTDFWEFTPFQTKICSSLAMNFHAISVREKTGVELCDKYLGVKATHVLDPTLLLSVEDYTTLCTSIPKRAPFVFAYILDKGDAIETKIRAFAASQGLDCVILSAGREIDHNDSIEKWLSNFRDAKYVITDSFHGTVFSIIFNKDFSVIGNSQRGNSRFSSLLDLLGLQDQFLLDFSCIPCSVNWKHVSAVLDVAKQESLSWLISSLE